LYHPPRSRPPGPLPQHDQRARAGARREGGPLDRVRRGPMTAHVEIEPSARRVTLRVRNAKDRAMVPAEEAREIVRQSPSTIADYGLRFIRYVLGAKENSERDCLSGTGRWWWPGDLPCSCGRSSAEKEPS